MADETLSRTPADSKNAMTLYGQAMTRSASVFGIGLAAIIPFGIVSLAITTRFLSPAEYGELAVLYAVASVLTILSGLGILHGTLIFVYGVSDDDAGDVDVDADVDVPNAANSGTVGGAEHIGDEKRRLLGTGLLLILVMSTGLCLATIGVGVALGLVFAGGGLTSAIAWMAASAWTGSLWRLAQQVPRMERRAGLWATLQFLRPALVLAATVAALIAGLAVDGVLMATALGTLLATVISLLFSKRCFRIDPQWGDVPFLWEQGKPWIPLTFAALIQSNVSVLVLGVLASPASVGLFQVASWIAQGPNYFASGFLTGWPAMERSPISIAAKERMDPRQYLSNVFTLFSLTTLSLIFAVSLFSAALIHIAAPSYDSAAPLIPIVAVAYGAQAVFSGVYRATTFPLRRYWFVLLHLIWIIPYAGVTALLIPLSPSYGVAIGQLMAGIVVSVCFVTIDRRQPESTPFEWRRLGLALLLASACVILVQNVPVSPPLHLVLSVVALVAFPLLLLLTGTIARSQLKVIKAILFSIVPRRMRKAEVRRRVASLPQHERDALTLVVSGGQTPDEAAGILGVSPAIVSARMIRGLRRVAGAGTSAPVDHLIGEYLLHPGSSIERDAWVSQLRVLGVDPLQLHLLDESGRSVSRLKDRSVPLTIPNDR